MARMCKVKNKNPASIQITAEHIIREARFWCRYATFEMSNRFLNHARNVWDRAVTLLPNVAQLWYKFIHMEEILGNIPGARQIFKRWMSHSPDRQGWLSYIKFELRYKEIERARHIFDRFVQCHPQVDSYVRYAKFELNHGEVHKARQCYERAAETLISVDPASCDNKDIDEAQKLFLSFAEFEEKCKETDRARCVYKYALDCLPKALTEDLYRKFIEFEKRYGDKESIENILAIERRFQYEERVRKSPLDYDAWFDYIRLEMEFGTANKDRIRDVYERAISNLPPAEEKHYWQRYIYLWINYALYEELDAQDTDRTREVYRECLKLIPHNKFSFSKVWLLAAQFEIRQKNLDGARKILGNSIGRRAARHKIFRKYIELELTLGNVDRCRALYTKYLEWSPDCSYAWQKYAVLEMSLSETERACAIFQLATAQPALDDPELLWKSYLDFEISQGELQRTRQIYDRLLERTKHWKVWSSYAMFEANAAMEGGINIFQEKDQAALEQQKKQCLEAARSVFKNALEYFRLTAPELKEERTLLLADWLNIERSSGQMGDVSLVENRLPKKLKRRREVITEGGTVGYEEYYDFVFPEETASRSLNILEAAYKWKRQKLCHTQA